MLALARMAFARHLEQAGQHRWWHLDDALSALDPNDQARADDLIKAGRAILVLDELEAEGRIRFSHSQLQEYFAARHWVLISIDEQEAAFERAEKGEVEGDPKLGEELSKVCARLRPNQRLPERPATGWEEVAVMAASLAGEDTDRFVERLSNRDLVTAGRAALATDSGVSDELKRDIRARLASYLMNPDVELRTRIDAGMVLDQPEEIGFQRMRFGGVECLLPPWGRLAPGEYTIGSDEGERPDENPLHCFVLESEVRLSRYPVTNAEYRLFLQAGGYENPRWWPEGEARSWWLAEREDTQARARAQELKSWSEEQFESVSARHGWSAEARAELVALRQCSIEVATASLKPSTHAATLKRPAYWHDDGYNRQLQPVVGICAFEAEAYVRWLRATTGMPVALPDERWWEIAARGRERRLWAYGDMPQQFSANTFELRLGRPSPVGVFAKAATPERLNDMSGNVWEWTASAWTDGYESSRSPWPDRRVVRGGSWTTSIEDSRGASRGRKPVDFRNHDIGFRVAVACGEDG